jgi:hypothetical protein
MSIRVRNYALTPLQISFRLEFGADYSDIFDVRGQRREHRGMLYQPRIAVPNGKIVLEYGGLDEVIRRTVAVSSPTVHLASPPAFQFIIGLDTGEEKPFEFSFAFETGHKVSSAPAYIQSLASATQEMGGPDRMPSRVSTSNEQFDDWLESIRRPAMVQHSFRP